MQTTNAQKIVNISKFFSKKKSFNPFRIFDKTVARKFIIRPDEHTKYTEEQLDELVPHNLRIFFIDEEVWYLAKDVCSFLGIAPNNVARSLKKIDSAYVRQESLKLSISSLSDEMLEEPSRAYKLYLLTEPGIYALIQKSRTQYAVEFKKWLNEEVLPQIRENGQYTLSPEDEKERNEIDDGLKFEIEIAKSNTREEVENEFKEILEEKDEIIKENEIVIKEKDKIIKVQKRKISMKNKRHAELMKYLKKMSMTTKKQIDSLKEDNKKQINSLKEDNKKQNNSLRNDFKKLQTKMDVVIKDRVAKPSDEGKLQVFAIYETGEKYSCEIIDKKKIKRFPYIITKCQTQLLETNEKKIQDKYENAKNIFSIKNPSAESLFQVLKEKVKEKKMGIEFDYCGIYFTNKHTINDVTKLVTEIDKDRTNIN